MTSSSSAAVVAWCDRIAAHTTRKAGRQSARPALGPGRGLEQLGAAVRRQLRQQLGSWGCPATDSGWTIDGEYRIWGRRVDVVPADPGRVDLATAIASEQVTVSTDLVAEDPAFGSLALVDGSLAPGSALRVDLLIDDWRPRLARD